jgi:Holliday junction resolvasome RuvABC endonuclease subunit
MLVIPDTSPLSATLVGHDPGSDTFGVGILQFNILTLEIEQTDAFTLKGKKLGRGTWDTEVQGDLMGRIWALEEELFEIYLRYSPFMVGSESPFISRKFPQAGLVLTRVMCSIHRALQRYDHWQCLHTYEPGVVKNAAGASGRAGKDPVRDALLSHPGLNYRGEVALKDLDEHSIDSLAVCLAMLHELRTEAGL